MKRASNLHLKLALAVLAGAFSLLHCAQGKSPGGLDKWQAGTNYTLLEKPQPTGVASGKVEVDEFFWYGCGHCYALDPTLESWKTTKASYIEFVRTPVMWSPMHEQHARIYYTLQALKRPDLHSKVFDAIHRDGNILAAQDEHEARAMHLAFFKANGVSEADFNQAYDSMSVATNLQKAKQATLNYQVSNVPLIFVNGKYSTGVGQAGSEEALLALINDLAASEKGR